MFNIHLLGDQETKLQNVYYLFNLLLPSWVHGDLWGHEGGHGHELKVGVADQLPGQPEEGLLEVVVGLGGDVVILEVLLSVEHD